MYVYICVCIYVTYLLLVNLSYGQPALSCFFLQVPSLLPSSKLKKQVSYFIYFGVFNPLARCEVLGLDLPKLKYLEMMKETANTNLHSPFPPLTEGRDKLGNTFIVLQEQYGELV